MDKEGERNGKFGEVKNQEGEIVMKIEKIIRGATEAMLLLLIVGIFVFGLVLALAEPILKVWALVKYIFS